MLNSNRQIVGYLVGLLAWLGSILIIFLPDWKHGIVRNDSLTGTVIMQGLWHTCTIKEIGSVECIHYGVLNLEASYVVRGCRTIGILAFIFATLGVTLTPLGLTCTSIGGAMITKWRIIKLSAVLFGLCGVLVGSGVTWFANSMYTDATDQQMASYFDDFAPVYGNALYIGWSACVSGLLSAVLLGIGWLPTGVLTNAENAAINKSEQKMLLMPSRMKHKNETDIEAFRTVQEQNRAQQIVSLSSTNNSRNTKTPTNVKAVIRQNNVENPAKTYNVPACKCNLAKPNKTYL
ncbi:unnamed protein product [Clavelina lepadiformis]|uniref:Claudin n=1 Tax=Clavelina lepadiformis TaxID=159417 RepID=A0ABP0GUP8_CLALP